MTKLYIPLNIQRFARGTIELSIVTLSAGVTFQGKIEWSSTSNSSSANTSTVIANLYARKQNTSSATTGKSWSGYLTIDGERNDFSPTTSISIKNDWVLLHTFTKIVSHNDDGSKSITIAGSVTGPSGTSLASATSSGSQFVALDTIPRYATITSFNAWGLNETQIRVNWNADVSCDWVQYSLNGGDWTNTSGTTFDIGGLSPNTAYSVRIRVRRTDSGLWTESGTIYASTYQYPYANSTPSFTIGQTLTIGLYNPLGRTVNVYLLLNDGRQIGGDQISGQQISGYVGEGFINDFYNSIPNSPSGSYRVKVVYGSAEMITNGGTYTIDYGASKPTFNYFTFEDINERTLALTKDKNAIVKGVSTVEVSIVGNEASGYKGSTITGYTVSGNGFSTTYSLYNFSGTTIKVFANDSRGNVSNPVELPINNLLDYASISKTSQDANRSDDGIGSQVTFEFAGKFWNKKFGDNANAVTNTLSAKYKYKQLGASEYGEEITINTSDIYISENGTFSFNKILAGDSDDNGFDIQKSYSVVITVSDKLSVAEYTYSIAEGSPAIDLVGNCVSLGGYYDEDVGGRVQIEGNSFEKINTYSKEEQFTGKYWIDGKKIYRRVFELGTIQYSLFDEYDLSIPNATIISSQFFCSYANTNVTLPAMVDGKLTNVHMTCYGDNIVISLLKEEISHYTDYTLWIIIEYTYSKN